MRLIVALVAFLALMTFVPGMGTPGYILRRLSVLRSRTRRLRRCTAVVVPLH